MIPAVTGTSNPHIDFFWEMSKSILPTISHQELGAEFLRPGTPLYTDPDDGLLKAIGVNEARFERPDGPGTNTMGLHEPGGENLIQYSHELGNVASSGWWTDINITSFTANGIVGPFGTTTADGMVVTAVDTFHILGSPLIAGVIQNGKVALSIYAKPGDRDWIRVQAAFFTAGDADLGDNGAYYFNISTGAVGTKVETSNAIVHDFIVEEAANGFYRVGVIVSTSDATVAKTKLFVFAAEADNDDTFAGDASTVNLWLEGADLKIQDTFDSHVPTSGSTASRATEQGQPHYTMPVQQNGKPIYETTLGAEEATGTLTIANVYKITATAGGNYFFTGDAVGMYFEADAETALDGTHKVQEVTNSYNGKPPESTTVVLWRPGYNKSDISAAGGILNLNDAAVGLIYHQADGTISLSDGTNVATVATGYSKGDTLKIVPQFKVNSNVYQMRIGAVVLDGDVVYGSWTTFNGVIPSGGNEFQFGYGLFGPMHIGDVRVYTRVLPDGEINAL